jgi:hypothetical protein
MKIIKNYLTFFSVNESKKVIKSQNPQNHLALSGMRRFILYNTSLVYRETIPSLNFPHFASLPDSPAGRHIFFMSAQK